VPKGVITRGLEGVGPNERAIVVQRHCRFNPAQKQQDDKDDQDNADDTNATVAEAVTIAAEAACSSEPRGYWSILLTSKN
jgi:hypothetical protein